jgi:hypothetical protein
LPAFERLLNTGVKESTMNLFKSTELDNHPRKDELVSNLFRADAQSLKVTQEIMADVPLKVRFQALNQMLVTSFMFRNLDLLNFVIENDITAQEGFFSDLGSALELFTRFRGFDCDDSRTAVFGEFLQGYVRHLGSEFALEAVTLLVPDSERSQKVELDYLEELENFVRAYIVVFGEQALQTVESGNTLLMALTASDSRSATLSSARYVLDSHLHFDSPAALWTLLSEDRLAEAPEFVCAFPESVRATLERIETPADHQPLLNLLIQYAGHIVLPIMIEQPTRFSLGSLRMASTTHEVLHGSEKGLFTLNEHFPEFKRLVAGVVNHPSFELSSHRNKELGTLAPNEFSLVSGEMAYAQGGLFLVNKSQYGEICQLLSDSRVLSSEGISRLDQLLMLDVAMEARHAFRTAQKHAGDDKRIIQLGKLAIEDLEKACVCQIAYEQLHKQDSKGFNHMRTPIMQAHRIKHNSYTGNSQAHLKDIAPYLASKMDDAFIVSVAPKDRHYLMTMLKAGVIKDRQFADLLTPAQRESLLVGDLGL